MRLLCLWLDSMFPGRHIWIKASQGRKLVLNLFKLGGSVSACLDAAIRISQSNKETYETTAYALTAQTHQAGSE